MAADKKVNGFSGKWAIVTLHPWLPSLSEQVARARAWGVDKDTIGRNDISALFVDDVRDVRTTNWMPKLRERSEFIARMRSIQPIGDQVFFATPLCVGFSAKLAKETMQGIWAAGMQVYVHAVKDNGSAQYVEGDDLADFLDAVAKSANAAHQRNFRANRS